MNRLEKALLVAEKIKTDLFPISNVAKATRIGSSNFQHIRTNNSDVDIVLNVTEWEPNLLIQELYKAGYDFFNKTPHLIPDALTGERVEFYLKEGADLYDITLIPERVAFENFPADAARDRLDVHIGNLYVHGTVLYGHSDTDDFYTSHFLPFYSDDLVSARKANLDWKIEKISNKLQTLDFIDIDYAAQLRTLYVRKVFLTCKKYPFSYQQYLDFQLSQIAHFDQPTIDALLLKDRDLQEGMRKMIEVGSAF